MSSPLVITLKLYHAALLHSIETYDQLWNGAALLSFPSVFQSTMPVP